MQRFRSLHRVQRKSEVMLVPELPEMENYKTLLHERLASQTVTKVEVNREKSINVSLDQFIMEVQDEEILGVERRAKHLIFKLKNKKNLLLHLMLGGWMYLGDEHDNPERTKQIILSFGDRKLYFIGLRLGYLHLLSEDELQKEFHDLGPEPLAPEFKMEDFLQLIDEKRGMLKTTLVDQKFLSGIGNCYSDEICYKAALLPDKKANELNEEQKRNLYHSIQSVLIRATDLGGYMDSHLYKEDKLTGGYNAHCYVYDREGEPCYRCGQAIIKDKISSRKSFYCRNCQH